MQLTDSDTVTSKESFWNENVLFKETEIEKTVVIIGAGCAGLECAQKLFASGVESLVVLEAQDYVGGRMKTELLDGDEERPLEYGANWIHGLWGNPLYKIVQENGELFHHKKKALFCDLIVQFADEHGRVFDPLMCLAFYDLYLAWNVEAKSVWLQGLRTNYDNYAEFMYAKLEEDCKDDSEEVARVKRALLKRLLIAETIESGCADMSEVSLNEYGSYTRPIGPDYEWPGGFQSLAKYLADQLPEGTVKTSHPVRHITFAPRRPHEASTCMLVECFNGVKYRAQHVVVTVSSSYLQRHYMSLFNPSLLSEQKILAINSIKMDTVDKIFLFYDDLSFFPPHVETLHPIFLDTDREFGHRVEDNWFTKLSSINRYFDDCLLVWITGREAHYVETLDNETIADRLTYMLGRLLSSKDVPRPTKVIKTTWHSNPYVLGSYSFIHRNSKSARKDVANLAAPIYVDNIPRVLFAGEATHLRYYSTVTGAYLSGQREAQRLIDHYGSDKLVPKAHSRI